MSRTKWTAAVLMLALVAAGCTGGEGGERVVAGGTPADDLISAIEATRAGSGRFRTAVGGPDPDLQMTEHVEGEFRGGDLRLSLDLGGDDPGIEWLVIDGRSFFSLGWLVREDDAMAGPMLEGLPEGAEWVEWDLDALEGGTPGNAWSMVPLMMTTFTDPFQLLGELVDVESAGRGEIDGARSDRFTARVETEAFLRAAGYDRLRELVADWDFPIVHAGDATLPSDTEEDAARVDAYLRDHLEVTVEADVVDGRLRRSVVDISYDLPEGFEDCDPGSSVGVAPTSLTTDFLDLGSEVDISAPEPGTTVSPDQMDEAFADGMGDQDLWLDEDTSPGGADAVLETVDGPRSRWAIEEDLSEFGQHLGFTGDPYELDDAALVAAYDDASAEMARQPRLATRYGPLSRVEVVVSLRWSPLSMFDELDETDEDVARLTDAELVQRIDRYFDEVLASGDVPDDPARLRTLLTLWGDHEPDDELMAAIVEHQMRAIEDLDLGKPGLDEDGGMFDPFTGCPPLDDGARTTTTFGG